VLIPSYAAGSIIGKGGQTIVQLQKETGATIKLSKSKDFYPGKSPNSRKPRREPSSTSSCLLLYSTIQSLTGTHLKHLDCFIS